ncbi:MAG: methylmalonyl Co-A mutase-associated GTPase MeaB [Candidatus Thermoplasmatota archaeon]
MPKLLERILSGDKRAVARAISLIEDETNEGIELLKALYKHSGKSHIIGVTGPLGVGKSTLIHKVASELRKKRKKVGIIAIDPTSPFSGGALLGDRIRMQELSTDDGIFIRSMATRGYHGGIAKATKGAVRILDASGMDTVIVETVGSGQSEVEIFNIVDTLLIVLVPGLGDEVQALKAGLFEIGNIFVINKADKDGVARLLSELEMMLELAKDKDKWKPPILKTIASEGIGISDVVQAIDDHYAFIRNMDISEKFVKKYREELVENVKEKIGKEIFEMYESKELDELIQKIIKKEIDPYSGAEIVLEKLKNS